jgi:NAD+ kinase
MAAITRIGIVAKTRLDGAAGLLRELAGWLQGRGITPVFETETAALAGPGAARESYSRDDLPRHADLVVVLGGDGTLIGMAGRIAQAQREIPILGVNFGGLGFLTEITLPELYPSLDSVLSGTAQIDERMMLRSRTIRGGRVFHDRLALNDVVITKGAFSRIIDLTVEIGSQPAMRIRADGLIVASPTGSTAYNLAAGGPILHPTLDALLVTPIAPHMLTNRPLVVAASSSVRVRPAMDGRDEVFVTIDGQSGHPLESDDEIVIVRADRPFRLIRSATRTYFEILREKLKWSQW